MKRYLLTSIFALASAACFAVDAAVEPITSSDIPEMKKNALETTTAKSGFTYLRMGVADTQAHQVPEFTQGFFTPGLGLGYRAEMGPSAIDVSASYTYGYAEDKEDRSYYYTLPKVSYYRFMTPETKSSFYYGAGLAWGGMKNKAKSEFIGIVPSATVGYEMNRKSDWRSFMQLDVSQPALAAMKSGDFPGPMAEFSIGFGY
ncbi:MAG: hypothetical protein JSS32_09740 [Verrucomicrobia bacterium]|nr:hypothetical protein [Verrucomicrobiota bacterium]